MLFDYIIPALACLAVLLDGVSTYVAIRRGGRERNPARRNLIDWLGLEFGSFGVSALSAYALWLCWPAMRSLLGDPSAALVYLTVASVMLYATFNNLKR